MRWSPYSFITLSVIFIPFVHSSFQSSSNNIDDYDFEYEKIFKSLKSIMTTLTKTNIKKLRSLGTSDPCQDEVQTLRQSNDIFQVKFPVLSKTEFKEHCIMSETAISCDLNNTLMVETYRTQCEEDAGGTMVQVNMDANGGCVGNKLITFLQYPLCMGGTCDVGEFIDSYEDTLQANTDLVGDDCTLDITTTSTLTSAVDVASAAGTSRSHRSILLLTITSVFGVFLS